ncbi:MAG: hypothetical protein JW987_06910 [Anaerolineaceae bacterium]|nr:hypothetical protein [Anaerolineaceae bacterium]
MRVLTFSQIIRPLLAFILALILAFQQPVLSVQAGTLPECGDDYCTFLPLIMRAAPVDLTVAGMEVTQAIQTTSNSVPLVAGRKTVVRIFAKAIIDSGAPSTISKIKLSATRNGVALAGAFETSLPAVSTNPVRSTYGSTVNVYLPDAWTSGTIILTATVDSAGQVAETVENNNAYSLTLTFNPVPNLKVMIVPVQYKHTPTGVTYPAPTVDTISTKIKNMYPVANVEILWHASSYYEGDLRQIEHFEDLLYKIRSLKMSEGQPSSVAYYALVPADWFSSGVVGIGFISYRAAVGLNYWDATGTAAHEIGHNFGLYHAPCGGPSSTDPYYPYAGGIIGQYGVNVYTNQLMSSTLPDLMSYCDNEWISDYHYVKLYNDQRLSADVVPETTGDMLMLRASLDSTGQASFSPTYQLDGIIDALAESSPYFVRLLAADGRLLSEQPVQLYEVADLPEPVYHLMTRVALPAESPAWVQLWRGGELLTEQALGGGKFVQSSPLASVQGEKLTWSGATGPVLVRYSADGGQTWQTLAVDAQGGSLQLDPALRDGLFEIIPAMR